MVFEMTIQVRVSDMTEGISWYSGLFARKPDFAPHNGIVEWEIFPGSWLQLAEGTPAVGSGPLRWGVEDIEAERERVMKRLNVSHFEIHSREEVPVKWGTFEDPWGNRVGFYEYLNKEEQAQRMETIFG
ncbi:VOC family protein [Guptibacillus algicola]|uniref:VOC family protein n=1 Tax=Guptibacillus algicola TaxID=225844 RepID=UPI001CD2B96A|nr:VOC family protein [Alkalihalobacillus algicola]MCA0987557.1 VOC family protein [Alkalihalobacillus algicola]